MTLHAARVKLHACVRVSDTGAPKVEDVLNSTCVIIILENHTITYVNRAHITGILCCNQHTV